MPDAWLKATVQTLCHTLSTVGHVFGVPGEENLDFVDALRA